jgi:Rrf2 family protein
MKCSLASRYALHALVYLATAKDTPTVPAHTIARVEGLPEDFLTKVLTLLVSARILYSLRGANGGYRLARAAKEITLLEIVEAVDGPLCGLAPALETAASAKLDGRLATICDQAAEVFRRQLQRARLSDLAGR